MLTGSIIVTSARASRHRRRSPNPSNDFARRLVGAEPMASALLRLSRDNASTLTTDPLYALVNFSHPPVPLRIARLQQA